VDNGGPSKVEVSIQTSRGHSTHWHTTRLRFNYALSRNVTIQTYCYGFFTGAVLLGGQESHVVFFSNRF